ncbi:hypothetical protein AOQ84DRAFT_148148 [Glonium stellatum]|uniref:Uncharacterized protein n=1 Tax=Glonium stellatum TaxID=574774 RepID=A0A8E2F8Y2_9PEZI|nr:hypothetical protein AOQ84DRAFT_148148 [Glonium stellatum]
MSEALPFQALVFQPQHSSSAGPLNLSLRNIRLTKWASARHNYSVSWCSSPIKSSQIGPEEYVKSRFYPFSHFTLSTYRLFRLVYGYADPST